MDNQQILKVLKNERDCIKNNHDYCYEDCDESCPYYVSEKDKLEVLDFLIKGYELLQNQGAEEYCIRCDTSKLSQEELDRFMGSIKGLRAQAVSIEADIEPLSPDDMQKIMGMESTD